MRQIVFSAQLDGEATAGDLLDRLAAMEPNERRALVDRARTECGLATTAEVDAERRAAAMFRSGTSRTLQRCAIGDCVNMPTNGLGAIVHVAARRWHCPEHVSLAAPGDMEPHGSGLRYGENGVLRPVDPADDRREAEARESERHQREARYAERTPEAASHDAHREAQRDQLQRELPEHLRETVA